MNNTLESERFQRWLASNPQFSDPRSHEVAQAAWYAAKLGQWEAVKAEVRTEIQKELSNLSVECFLNRDHGRARFYQDLSDERHSLWEDAL